MTRARICPRCNGGGFVATKHGPVRCPHCKGTGTMHQPPDNWRDTVVGLAAYALIVAVMLWWLP